MSHKNEANSNFSLTLKFDDGVRAFKEVDPFLPTPAMFNATSPKVCCVVISLNTNTLGNMPHGNRKLEP